jgi:NDP-sugar pyrophosphorylase family protein
MKAMIFAAGLGTRLKPITDTMPKALVPVCGKPLLYHTICKLRSAGYDDIVVNVHHFPEQIRQYLQENDFGVRISISDESDQLLETGGGILKARNLLLSDEPFLVHNVDIVSNLDLAELAVLPGDLATLVVSARDTRRYLLFDDDMRLVGWTDTSTGEVRSPYPELNPTSCQKYAFSGIHMISPAVFDAMSSLGFTGRFPIMDFYLKACSTYHIRAYLAENLQMVDVGKIDTLPEAEHICATLL